MRGAHVYGEAIRALRAAAGLTQEQLARRADLDVTTLRKMEKGEKSFDLQSVAAVARALDCEVRQLIDASETLAAADGPERLHLACVARHREAFLNQDVEAVLACYTDDAVIDFPSSIPSPSSGRFVGREAIRRHLELTFQTFRPQIPTLEESDVYAVGDRVLLRHVSSAVVLHNGVEFTAALFFEYQFRGGKICNHVGLFDTAVMAEALNAPPTRNS
jgi:transcriptional regulator with XRE-family HTH domain